MPDPTLDPTHRVAIVQRPPVSLDRAATIDRALAGLDEAVGGGARLVVFPETYVPGYPEYIWGLRPGDDGELSRELHGRLIEQAVDLEADDLKPIRDAARRHGVLVVIGVHERDGAFSRATLYNTLVTIGPDGAILNRHRKLVPTNAERMVWSPGDGSGLRVMDTPMGRLGGLICWENYMPLARYAMYAWGTQIYVAATWDRDDTWLSTIRHIAKEGRVYVLSPCIALRKDQVPDRYEFKRKYYGGVGEWVNVGDSAIVDPNGQVIAGPLHEQEGILYAEIDPRQMLGSKWMLDVAGHYGRPDVFELTVNTGGHPVVRT